MKDGFKVMDADRHVLEPSDLFGKYLPEKFRSRVEIKGPNQTYRVVDGEKISDADKLRDTSKQEDFGFTFGGSKRWRETFAEALAAKFDPASNVRDMDKEGVDGGVLFPTLGLYIMWRDNLDPELSAAICRAYNTWLSDYCSYDHKRPRLFKSLRRRRAGEISQTESGLSRIGLRLGAVLARTHG